MAVTNPVRIYLAGPLFTQAEWQWNSRLVQELRGRSFDVVLPQEHAEPMLSGKKPFDPAWLFQTNIDAIKNSTVVVAVFDGADADSGTAWECGFAYQLGCPVIGVRSDIRAGGDDPKAATNLMLSISCRSMIIVPFANRCDISWIADQIAAAI